MRQATYQTVRIARGRHRSPEEGACVMELSSMLAGERFTDRPRCVDPVLGAFLRAFNDRLAPLERQRLYPYAAAVVGTRGDRRLVRTRRDRCLAFAGADPRGRSAASAWAVRLAARVRLLLLTGIRPAVRLAEGAGEWAAREAAARGDADAGFALLDALLRDGGTPPPAVVPAVGSPSRRAERPAPVAV